MGVPQLHIPQRRLDGDIGQRPQSAGFTPSIGGCTAGTPSAPSTPCGIGSRVPTAEAAERIQQAAGLTRASTAPTLGSGTLFESTTSTASRRSLVPPTSNKRYGWIECPPHLAYKPKKKVRAEEVVYKEHHIRNMIPYSPRIRFCGKS